MHHFIKLYREIKMSITSGVISLPIFMVKELLVAVIILSEFKLQQIHSNIIIHLEMLPAI